MHKRLKLSPHHHTGRLLPHRHTSFGMLFVMVLVAGVLSGGISWSADAAPHPDPQSGYIGLTGKVPSKPPSVAAVILKPGNGLHTGTSPITVSGTCPKGTIVEIFKNDIFAGSAACTDGGTFSLDVDLLFGANALKARVFDALDQAGPDSNIVNVSYDALPPQADPIASLSFSSTQLLLETTAVYRGTFPGQDMIIPLQVLGGTPPFAINIVWGDASNTLLTRSDNIPFDIKHVYTKAGTYSVTMQATDAQQRVAFLTVVVIINGKGTTALAGPTQPNKSIQSKLLILWPLYAILLVAVTSFWLGERRERHILEAQGV